MDHFIFWAPKARFFLIASIEIPIDFFHSLVLKATPALPAPAPLAAAAAAMPDIVIQWHFEENDHWTQLHLRQ